MVPLSLDNVPLDQAADVEAPATLPTTTTPTTPAKRQKVPGSGGPPRGFFLRCMFCN